MTKMIAEQLKEAVPSLDGASPTGQNAHLANMLVNHTRAAVRRRRRAARREPRARPRRLIQAVRQGAGCPGAALVPPPFGSWGLQRGGSCGTCRATAEARKAARARKLLAEAGYGPGDPAALRGGTRARIADLRRPGLLRGERAQAGRGGGQVKQLDTAQWYGATARKEFQLGTNITGSGSTIPTRSSTRTTRAAPPELHRLLQRGGGRLIDQQSQELDRAKRLALVSPRSSGSSPRPRRPADAGLAHRLLHPLALREGPRAASLALQLAPDAGGLAGSLARLSPRSAPPGTARRDPRPRRGGGS